jgi:hypothetical protein
MKTPQKPYTRLLALKSTKLLSSVGGRKIYEVVISAAFKAEHFIVGRGFMLSSAEFELKQKADVTGNPYDKGYLLIDKREQNAARNSL